MALTPAVDDLESSVDESGRKCLFVCQKKTRKVVQRDCVYGKANQGVRVRR